MKRDHFSDDHGGGRLQMRRIDPIRDVAQGAGDGLLIGPGAPAHGNRWRRPGSAVLDQLAGDLVNRADSHEDHQRLGLAHFTPVDSRGIVPGDEGHQLGVIAMRQRHTAISCDSERRRNARDNFKLDAGIGQRFQFFAAAAEYERIAAFEPDHGEPASRPLNHHAGDFFLREGVYGFLLADVDAFAVLGRELEQVLAGEVIVEDCVSACEELATLPGDQVRIARPGSNQVNLAHVLSLKSTSAPYTASSIFAPPWANSSSPSALPSAAAWEAGPLASFRITSRPSGETMIDRMCTVAPSNVACAPIGTWHPPPKAASTARSAVTAARVAA